MRKSGSPRGCGESFRRRRSATPISWLDPQEILCDRSSVAFDVRQWGGISNCRLSQRTVPILQPHSPRKPVSTPTFSTLPYRRRLQRALTMKHPPQGRRRRPTERSAPRTPPTPERKYSFISAVSDKRGVAGPEGPATPQIAAFWEGTIGLLRNEHLFRLSKSAGPFLWLVRRWSGGQ